MREPTQRWCLNRAKVQQWLPVVLLAIAFLTGALARTVLSPLPVTATPESEELGDTVLAAVPDEAMAATTLNSTVSCQRAMDASLTCTASDPDGVREVQVLDAVTGDKVAKGHPTPACRTPSPTTSVSLTVPAARATHDLLFRVVDCAARVPGQSTGRDWHTALVTGAAAAPRTANAASGSNPVTVSGPRATR